MNKRKIEIAYAKKIRKLIKYNQQYYDENNSLITDTEYDVLKKDILDLEKKHDFLDHENSPSRIVGQKPSNNFKNVTQNVPMVSRGHGWSVQEWIRVE